MEQWFERNLASSQSIDGVELHLSWDELIEGRIPHFPTTLLEKIFSLPYSTLHLPHLTALPKSHYERLPQTLVKFHDATGITDFTVHPDRIPIELWATLQKRLPKGLYFSIENTDLRTASHQRLEELGEILDLHNQIRWTFDVCHWVEGENSLETPQIHEFFSRYGERLSKVHFSTPVCSSPLYTNNCEINTFHYLTSGSENLLLESLQSLLPDYTNWVVEGVIPPRDESLLNEEIALLKGDGLTSSQVVNL